jgi:hypothetical protein
MTHIKLHPGQSAVYEDLFIEKTCRFSTAVCSRGWGKSFFAGVAATTACFELMELPDEVPNKNVYIIAPTYDQVTDIYYPLLYYELGLEDYVIKASKDTGRFEFPGNVNLRLISFEAIERMRGKGAYFVVNDEVSSWTKGLGFKAAWQGIIQPCIVTRWSPKNAKRFGAKSPGRALTISTPKGYNFLYDMFNMPEIDPLWKSYHFDYRSSPYLDPAEIERIRHSIDPLEFAAEYLADFKESGNNVFYCFERKIHVRKDVPEFVDGEAIHIGIDFNVGLQCSSVFALRGSQIHFLDEFKGHPDTEQLAIAIKGRYPGRKIYVYPDPTGNARKTSAPVGRTDFSILQGAGFEIRARSKSPGIVDSVNAVNKHLQTAAGDVNMFVHPRCTGIITSLERTKWVDKNPDTATIDKSEGVEHFSDSVRYATEYLFPVQSGTKRVHRGFKF